MEKETKNVRTLYSNHIYVVYMKYILGSIYE